MNTKELQPSYTLRVFSNELPFFRVAQPATDIEWPDILPSGLVMLAENTLCL